MPKMHSTCSARPSGFLLVRLVDMCQEDDVVSPIKKSTTNSARLKASCFRSELQYGDYVRPEVRVLSPPSCFPILSLYKSNKKFLPGSLRKLVEKAVDNSKQQAISGDPNYTHYPLAMQFCLLTYSTPEVMICKCTILSPGNCAISGQSHSRQATVTKRNWIPGEYQQLDCKISFR
ncbi:hypothetical protein M514_11803 [Trichuris suis]|uniref:Uncharacterized protein n=1 Tax=Trichuris suis TaxID=68888 RepID=A0A085LQP7_9BILA|nr:hypothetical protein M513_11803 [Trichuris suis]KFD64521.1 hypothetical protein M514_11803 [Trichuris suis]